MAFEADWLALREDADRGARASDLLARLNERLSEPALDVVDLGAGASAAFRALAPVLARPQRWRLFDRDRRLLVHGIRDSAEWARAQEWAVSHSERALRVDVAGARWRAKAEVRNIADDLPVRAIVQADLVVAAALLDLVSRPWIERLAEAVVEGRTALYASLIYNGRLQFAPGDVDDSDLVQAFNRHQRRDKGFGPALGPDAATELARAVQRHGFSVRTQPSDWMLGADDDALIAALLDGLVQAAGEIDVRSAARFAGWADRRKRQSALGELAVRVGHVDVLAMPLHANGLRSRFGARARQEGEDRG